MLSLFLLPAICGGIYWIIHKAKGTLTDRNRYKRGKVFGFLFLIMLALEIAGYVILISVAANNPENPAAIYGKVGGRTIMLIIGPLIGWNWLRLTWTSYETIQSGEKSQGGPGQVFAMWKQTIANSKPLQPLRDLEKNMKETQAITKKLKPYAYNPPLTSNKESQKEIATEINSEEVKNKIINNLKSYKKMYEDGLISEDEYGRLKRKELGI